MCVRVCMCARVCIKFTFIEKTENNFSTTISTLGPYEERRKLLPQKESKNKLRHITFEPPNT